MQGAPALDLERVVCRLTELERLGARAFTIGVGDWPLRGFVVRVGDAVRGQLKRCPHARHPLNLLTVRFLKPDGVLILCCSHGALFEKSTGYCVAGPCAGRALTPVALETRDGFVLVADRVAVNAVAQTDGERCGWLGERRITRTDRYRRARPPAGPGPLRVSPSPSCGPRPRARHRPSRSSPREPRRLPARRPPTASPSPRYPFPRPCRRNTGFRWCRHGRRGPRPRTAHRRSSDTNRR